MDHTIRHGITSMLNSVAQRDDLQLEDLATLNNVNATLTTAIEVAVHNLRRQGHSWNSIAGELGITRQAAWAHYNKSGEQALEGR